MGLSIGERLRSAREAKGLTLEEVCRVTKIQRSILEAIEADQVEEVLELAYARIFIKKYAAFLGLDGAGLVEEYVAIQGGLPQVSLSVESTSSRQPAAPALRKVLVPAAVGLVGLIGLVFISQLAAGFLRSAASGPGRRPSVQPSSAAGSPPPSKPLIPLSKPLRLTINTSQEVWLQVKSDGTVVFQNVLPKGARESWVAKRELELWTGNAGAMDLSLNGKALGSLGRGVKKGVKVTHLGLEFPK